MSLLTIFVILSTKIAGSQEWRRGESKVNLDEYTLLQAKEEGLKRAWTDALSKAGIEVVEATARAILINSSDSTENDYRILANYTRTMTRGHIAKYRVIKQEIEEIPISGYGQTSKVSILLTVVEALVVLDLKEPDRDFILSMNLNQNTYRENDPLIIEIFSSKDCYLTIFNLYSYDSLAVIFPNQHHPDNRIKANEAFVIPSPNSGWKLKLRLLPGRDHDSEALLAIATKEDEPFKFKQTTSVIELISIGSALSALNEWLTDIDADRRTQDMEIYRIVK